MSKKRRSAWSSCARIAARGLQFATDKIKNQILEAKKIPLLYKANSMRCVVLFVVVVLLQSFLTHLIFWNKKLYNLFK
jgi:hypothetical protein